MTEYDWIVLDCNNLCHRAFYAIGDMSHKERPVGVLFGFFRDLLFFYEQQKCSNFVFCFDSGPSLRKTIYPKYKERFFTEKEKEDRKKLYVQMELIKKELSFLGFSNVFQYQGYEADDIIASISFEDIGNILIVSSDRDLYQLLSPTTTIFNTTLGKKVTLQSFFQQWKIIPDQWPVAKAIAGDRSDTITGVKGVGEITAAKYLAGTLSRTTKAWGQINKTKDFWIKNLKLVRLPFKGCPNFIPKKQDPIGKERWNSVMQEYGLDSLLCNKNPFEEIRHALC